MTPPTPGGYRQDANAIGVGGENESGLFMREAGIVGEREYVGEGEGWVEWLKEVVDGVNEKVFGWFRGEGSGGTY